MTAAQAAPPEAGDRALLPDRYRFAPGEPLRILGSRSVDTGSLYFPRRVRCPRTGGPVEDMDLATEGTLWSWAFVEAPWPGPEHPNGSEADDGYGVAIVDLDSEGDAAGPRLPTVLVGPGREWQIGDRVRACELPFATQDGVAKSILAFEVIG